MNFAGNNFTYISKKKYEKLKKKENLFVNEGNSRENSNNRSRSRSRSFESIDSEILDNKYSDIEEEDEEFEISEKRESTNTNEDGFFSKITGFFKGDKKEKKKKEIKSKNESKAQSQKPKMKEKNKEKEKKVYQQEIDTNVISIRFNFLKEKVPYATGDSYSCNGCKSILNIYSKLSFIESSQKREWICEFCLYKNEISIENEEIPNTECVDYFLQSMSQKEKMNFNDEKTILYCFDVSGSMCVSEALDGKFKIKGDYLSKLQSNLSEFLDGSSQNFHNNQSNITYISRLQCLKAAIESYISHISKVSPKNKIGIVTFSNEVHCYGDCSTKEIQIINGNDLYNDKRIIELASKSENLLKKSISDSETNLISQLYQIEESGQTALGPGILFSINLIRESAYGSKIILCTDGIANLGVGSLDNVNNEESLIAADKFYTNIGEYAKEKGIVINLLTFEGEESRISILSKLCILTGGEILKVKPAQVLTDFNNIMQNEIVATNVNISIRLPSIFEFRNEEEKYLQDSKSIYSKDIGNVTNETELFVEYTTKSVDELVNNNIKLENIKEVVFQSKIIYTDMKGNQCMRVISKRQEISSNKEMVRSQADYNILSTNIIQHCGNIASKGQYRTAQVNAAIYKKMIKSEISNNNNSLKSNYNQFNKNMNIMNEALQEEYEKEVDDEVVKSNEEEVMKKVKNMRVSDKLSYSIHNCQTKNINKMNKYK